MGTIHAVPKKLAVGMKVVVYVRPGTRFVDRALNKIAGKWTKATYLGRSRTDALLDFYTLDLGYSHIVVSIKNCIIVRSVTAEDNNPARTQKALETARNRYKAKKASLAGTTKAAWPASSIIN